jgi:hypothetical protein
MASFEIRTASRFLQKFRQDREDFIKSDFLSERHALNAIITAYHLIDWVWGDFAKDRHDLYSQWHISSARDRKKQFEDYLFAVCPALADARELTNGTKHFADTIETGKHEGAFQRGVFQDDAFDVSYLWIERSDGRRQQVEDFIRELVDFWDAFFLEHGIG